ncbi:MAG: flagellar basal-body rod protein FlgG [Rhodospirillales bacterium]
MKALGIASLGMLAQQHNVDVLANNLANMNTTAYRRVQAGFQDLVYTNMPRPGSSKSSAGPLVPAGVQRGHGVELGSTMRINEQGSLKATHNTLDLAIQGPGFFQIQLPGGEQAYSRIGTFQLNNAGQIVTHDGNLLAGGIAIPANALDVSISPAGTVQVKLQGQQNFQAVGQIQVVTFQNQGGLNARGDGLLFETTASGPPTPGIAGVGGRGTVLQGYLETSNVNPIQEIAKLVAAQRAYEMNSRVVRATDEMMQSPQ